MHLDYFLQLFLSVCFSSLTLVFSGISRWNLKIQVKLNFHLIVFLISVGVEMIFY